MESRYRESFTGSIRAEAYDELYAPDSYASLLWEIEKEFLARFVSNLRVNHQRINYMDYACGTGRVLSFIEPSVDSATGIDVSQDMLDRARSRTGNASLLKGDASEDSAVLGNQKYDLITLFRFLLNTEPKTRSRVVGVLAGRLKDNTSRFVFNNHGNPFSHKMVMLPSHMLRSLGHPRGTLGNYLTHRDILACISGTGLEIESVYGYGYISNKMLRLLGPVRTLWLERFLAGAPVIQVVGVNQIYVAKLRINSRSTI